MRGALLDDFGIEIGTSFGPLHGRVWRIGTMGYNARKDAVLTTLAALEQVLRRRARRLTAGGGVGAAREVYAARTLRAACMTPGSPRQSVASPRA